MVSAFTLKIHSNIRVHPISTGASHGIADSAPKPTQPIFFGCAPDAAPRAACNEHTTPPKRDNALPRKTNFGPEHPLGYPTHTGRVGGWKVYMRGKIRS